MYNSLLIELKCPVCASVATRDVQFKYGNLRRYEYREGDELVWGTPQVGDPRFREVLVLGITDCDSCSTTFWCNLRVSDSRIFFDSIHDGSMKYPAEEFIVRDAGDDGGAP